MKAPKCKICGLEHYGICRKNTEVSPGRQGTVSAPEAATPRSTKKEDDAPASKTHCSGQSSQRSQLPKPPRLMDAAREMVELMKVPGKPYSMPIPPGDDTAAQLARIKEQNRERQRRYRARQKEGK